MLAATLSLAGIGLTAAIALGLAAKKFAVEIDPREVAILKPCPALTAVHVVIRAVLAIAVLWSPIKPTSTNARQVVPKPLPRSAAPSGENSKFPSHRSRWSSARATIAWPLVNIATSA